MEAALSRDVHFSLLGRLRAGRDGREIDLGSPQQRAVAAALLLARGRGVRMSDLVDAVWERPPNSPSAAVRTYIWRLRRALEPGHDGSSGPWRILRSTAGGYLLDVGDDRVDWQVFKRRIGEAGALRAGGDTAAARLLYDSALAMWRETPLAGVPGPLADSERAVMQARHLDVLEARLESLVESGHWSRAAVEAAALVEQHPLREGLHQLLMRSLLHTGRQAEALNAYGRIRGLLAEELGVEPGEGLRSLHAEILRGGRPAVVESTLGSAVHREAPVPRQIPHAIADFTGRTDQTERIRDALLRHSAEAVPIVLVTGMGGAGKTALVMHSVRPTLPAYTDGQLYADLRGADGTPAGTGGVLSAFLRALGEPDASLPEDLQERAALYRSVLAQRRVLIVLDNAADMEQVAPLLPGSPSCAVAITSRNCLATLPVGLRVTLGALPAEEALDLFTRLVGSARVMAEPDAARQVLTACGGLPLAVRVIGSQLAARPEWSMAQLAERLADARHRLSDAEAETASAVPAAPEDTVRRTLERLVDAGLLESPAGDDYRHHDLVVLGDALSSLDRAEQKRRRW
ncbi:AfsR/SARP family transcriptional regulator [Streptomyces sp. NBC_00878]|uniref:AfsR/SARP family transcriptional regulator n=1 Tax=Streptomyces sp. NBC_00878 TaxID=2975854 RepID=UPI002259B812|nr:AfsR/SARP family transcriptional regulator [Streptomyces sp. NBC_00878]MCX4903738.1 NB-ARC domain-containing protein [Streptomyces sp. NBC_00878]